jgi:tetratricopeptide (TPR) repeat protein
LLGPDELAALEALSTELDNYRAAVNWALERDDRDDQDLGIRIISGLASQAYLGANASVGAWAEFAVPHVGETTPEHRSRLLGAAAMAVMARGEHARARDLAMTALENDDDAAGLSAYPYGALSYSQVVSGEYANSIATLVEGERLIRENAPESFDHLHMLMSLSSFRAMDPDDATALPVAEETMRVARLLGSDYILVHSLLALGMSLQRDNPEAARDAYEEAYAIAQRLRHGIFGSLTSYLAVVRLRTGDLDGAFEALRDGFVFFSDTGERPQLVAAVNRAIRVVAAFGEHGVAATLVGVASDGPLAGLNNFPDSRLEDGHPIVLRLQSDLGDERFTDARRRGAAMNYDEVVDFVLTETDRILRQMHDG